MILNYESLSFDVIHRETFFEKSKYYKSCSFTAPVRSIRSVCMFMRLVRQVPWMVGCSRLLALVGVWWCIAVSPLGVF